MGIDLESEPNCSKGLGPMLRLSVLFEPFYDFGRSEGRPSIPPGVDFRMRLIGNSEGIESMFNLVSAGSVTSSHLN